MTRPRPNRRATPAASAAGTDPTDLLIAGAALAVAVLLATVWAGAALAAQLGGVPLRATPGDVATALLALPSNLSDPAAAWPTATRAALPGPFLYWASQLAVVVAVGVVVRVVCALVRPGREADGLGVERSARFAGRRDLVRLRVPGPVQGRIVLGRVRGRLVATEPRTSVCVVGPTQSGKTSGLCVPALLELDRGGGAVVAASVKGDLHSVTVARRASLGEVKVFDPLGVAVEKSATWSPLRAAGTVSGAQTSARALVDVAGRTGLENADFWMQSAKELLWPLLYVAANTGAAMRDVVRWVTTHDRPLYDVEGRLTEEGEVARCLRLLQGAADRVALSADTRAEPASAEDVALATQALNGLWSSDERTRSAVYATARTVVEAWSDPAVARAADGCDITPEWLLSGDNSLYIVAPARDQARLRPVFASLVADLVHEAFDLATRTGGDLRVPLLVLLDEAANICPVRELPAWCSTCPSHGITLVTVWQDRSQQRLRYGREGAETIWNNSPAKVVLSGLADAATAEVTHLLGEEEHERVSTSVDGGGRRSFSSQVATRRLVSEDSLRRQRPGQGLLVYRDLPPMRLTLRPWHADRRLSALKEAKPRRAEGRLEPWGRRSRGEGRVPGETPL